MCWPGALSNSLTSDACIDALREAILKYGAPGIMNTDQGSQFTSSAFIGMLQQHSIQVSMDGKDCWRDNVFVEQLWKSVKYEEIYLHGYDTVSVARRALTRYFDFYNRRRPWRTTWVRPRPLCCLRQRLMRLFGRKKPISISSLDMLDRLTTLSRI